MELLAPGGNLSKVKTAFHFGADAVYIGGKDFSLRAYADNFNDNELEETIIFAHSIGKKVYITLNIFPKNKDFERIAEYLKYLDSIFADAVIVSDAGVIEVYNSLNLRLPLHLSTQANTLNKYSAKFWVKNNVKRLILARELSLFEVAEIANEVKDIADVEIFVHGAMCISYSGRCVLSNYLTKRDANRGECVQACRWEYSLTEKNRKGEQFDIAEDERGTYILNSRDLNMLKYLKKVVASNVSSLKIEGRMKSEYYVATVVNAYRRALNLIESGNEVSSELVSDLDKAGHRMYTTCYYLGSNEETQNHETSKPDQTHDFIGQVEKVVGQYIFFTMRNRFKIGDKLEVLSNDDNFNKAFVVEEIFDLDGNVVEDAKYVEQKLRVKCPLSLQPYDILRMEKLAK